MGYETAYVTSHKGSCRAGAFSADGLLCATGSMDASIKVLDVERMLAKSSKDNQQPGSRQSQESESGHPVIRTLYDHFEVIICSNVPFQRHEHEKCAMLYSYMAMHCLVLTKTNKSNCSK